MFDQSVIAKMVAAIEATGDFRVLRRLTLDDVPDLGSGRRKHSVARRRRRRDHWRRARAAQDHRTGFAPVSIRRRGVIVKVDRPHAWLQDPGAPLDKEIAALTGLTDADLAGQTIDDAAATKLLKSAAVVIAHHAAFDRRFVERRLPEASGLAWACSCHEIDWQAAGFAGKGLGWLLAQAGYFFNGAHRAGADVDAVIALLRLELPRRHGAEGTDRDGLHAGLERPGRRRPL
jgi:DNA polymerase III epsilon subunit-like protein